MIETTKYRVRIAIYDDVNTTWDNPEIIADEPLYGGDELSLIAQNLVRQLRRHIESEQ